MCSKAVARAMYEFITDDKLASRTGRFKATTTKMDEFALAARSFDIIVDMRHLNGRPKSDAFDMFWAELKSMLEPEARVDDRRHGNACYLHVAMSVRDMVERAATRLRERYPQQMEEGAIKIPS